MNGMHTIHSKSDEPVALEAHSVPKISCCPVFSHLSFPSNLLTISNTVRIAGDFLYWCGTTMVSAELNKPEQWLMVISGAGPLSRPSQLQKDPMNGGHLGPRKPHTRTENNSVSALSSCGVRLCSGPPPQMLVSMWRTKERGGFTSSHMTRSLFFLKCPHRITLTPAPPQPPHGHTLSPSPSPPLSRWPLTSELRGVSWGYHWRKGGGGGRWNTAASPDQVSSA